jgi:hypothetical protein
VLRLIKLGLKAPFEERDGDGKRRMVGGKRNKRGNHQRRSGGRNTLWRRPVQA